MNDKLKDVVSLFDTIMADQFTGQPYGLSEQFTSNSETYPATISAKRQKIAPSDSFQLQTYHRILNSVQLPSENDFGNRESIDQNMLLVIISDVKLGEDFVHRFVKAMPYYLQIVGLYATVRDGLVINPDSQTIGQNEFGTAWLDKYRVTKNIFTVSYTLTMVDCDSKQIGCSVPTHGGNVDTKVQRTVDSSGATVTFNFENTSQRLIYVCDTVFASNKTFSFTNTFNFAEAVIFFEISSSIDVILPAAVIMNDIRWNSSTNTISLIDSGKYKAQIHSDGTNYYMEVSQNIFI